MAEIQQQLYYARIRRGEVTRPRDAAALVTVDTRTVVAEHRARISTEAPWLTPRRSALTVVVSAAAIVVLGRSARVLVASPPSRDVLTGMLVLALLVWVADRMPVPIGSESVSLSFVFVVCAAVMYGATAAALVTAVAVGTVEVQRRAHVVKAAYNTGSWALVAVATGVAASLGGDSDVGLLLAVALASAAFFVTNVTLVAAVAADVRLRHAAALAWSWAKPGLRPFVLGVSVAPLFVECWRTSHLIATAAVIPVLVIGLHLRSSAQSREATMLALTDPLTGLGNRRHFSERLQQELARADDEMPLSVCLIDLDDFKSINDRYGHETGDAALIAIAGTLRQGGEAFRLGGDEFVLLLPRHTAERAVEVATAVSERVQSLRDPPAAPLSISTGTATYPSLRHGRDDLLRVADQAVYAEKTCRRGKWSTPVRKGRNTAAATASFEVTSRDRL